MINLRLAIVCIALGCFSLSNAAPSADEREKFSIEEINVMDGGDLCPINSRKRFHHHFVLVDATADLQPSQLKLLERLVLSEVYLAKMMPWDRLTIMMLRDVKPAKNLPLFSKCRPRSGDPSSRYMADHHDWISESQSDLTGIYQNLFVARVNETIKKLGAPRSALTEVEDALTGSPILSQIKEISRLPDMGFTKDSGYKRRTLTIVSDLAQNTNRLPFYDQCPGDAKCPVWESFKNDKKYKLWAKRVIPDFGAEVDVKLVYLNNNFDKNIDKGVLEFWTDFFVDSGIEISDMEFESDS